MLQQKQHDIAEQIKQLELVQSNGDSGIEKTDESNDATPDNLTAGMEESQSVEPQST